MSRDSYLNYQVCFLKGKTPNVLPSSQRNQLGSMVTVPSFFPCFMLTQQLPLSLENSNHRFHCLVSQLACLLQPKTLLREPKEFELQAKTLQVGSPCLSRHICLWIDLEPSEALEAITSRRSEIVLTEKKSWGWAATENLCVFEVISKQLGLLGSGAKEGFWLPGTLTTYPAHTNPVSGFRSSNMLSL